MFETLNTLCLLLYKNFLVRKRRWLDTIIEFTFAIIIIILILIVRSTYDIEPQHVSEVTYYPSLTKSDLVNDHIPKSILHLYYKPRNNFTDEFMKNVTRCAELPHDQLFGFDNEDEMLQSYEIQIGKDELISVMAIDFGETKFRRGSVPKKLIYKMRSSQSMPENLFDFDSLSSASDKLIQEIPIVAFQMCLNDVFIHKVAADGATIPTIVIPKMPYPPYDNINDSELLIQDIICIFGGLIFLVTIYLIPSYVSAEKTSGVNTVLKMNGVKSYQNLLSWLVSGMLFSVVPAVVLTLLLKSDLYSQKPFYYHSNCSIIWLALFLNSIHVYAFCLHIASYFCKAWLAQMLAVTLCIFTNIITMQFKNTEYFCLVPYLGILFPTVATTRIFDELNKLENELIGAHWSTVFETANPELTVEGSLGFILLFSILGIILHFLLAIYLDAVLPSKYGPHKQPFFFFKYFTNCFVQNKVYSQYERVSKERLSGQPEISEDLAQGALTPWIELRNLFKCFTCGIFTCSQRVNAVKGISLNIYKGQITALLGHNGAGKTTTFSILTGLTPPSEGKVYINQKDISTDLDAIRRDLGVCPQENTVFSDLTVHEQLGLIGWLKQTDKTRQELIVEVDKMLEKLNLLDKRDALPETLSGGQKRRLCLGMALIGNASTIFLDEPTSGMDPETRRHTWDLILEYRSGKTIVITTHSMEEADVLGDQIAIMQSGQVKCYGTPMFLKKRYGHNYHQVTLSTTPSCDKVKIRDMVGSEANIKETHRDRIVISIPFTSSLPGVLDNMEKQKKELGITGISVSAITLEQVFLKAGESEDTHESIDHVDGSSKSNQGVKYLTGSELTRQKIKALLSKKWTYFKNNSTLWILMLNGVLLALLLPLCYPSNYSKTSNRVLSLSLFESPEALIYSDNKILGEKYKEIVESQGATGILMKTGDDLSHELLSRATRDLTYYKTRMIIAAELNSSLIATGYYSGGATFSAPITLNAMSNLVLKTVAGDEYSIVASIDELPRLLKLDPKEKTAISIRILTRTILFMTIFFHIVALFVNHPLLENITKMKQLQRMAGASAFLYWGTMFIIDYAFYIIITAIAVFGIFLTNSDEKSNGIFTTEIGVLFLLFLLFGINILLLSYIHSFIKKQFHLVYSILSGIPLLLTFMVVSASKILMQVENAEKANIFQRRIFSLQPHVSFVFGYMKFSEIASDNARCRGLSNRLNEAACAVGDMCCNLKCSDGKCENPLPYLGNFSKEGGFEEFFTYLLLTPLLLVGILCLLEQQTFAKLQLKLHKKKPQPKDQRKEADIELEKEKSIVIQSINKRNSNPHQEDKNVFLAYELSKSYGKLQAVKEVNFRVKKNECFGLLGVNGAGKSTTFRMLVGEELSTGGILCRNAYDINSHREEYLSGIGYCPQNDALIPSLNAFDHLSLFARLRGTREVDAEVNSWIAKLRLNKSAGYPSGSYSGGNKRRLNIAMALIASPKLVLLDEPTTGVDPAARRLVWTILQDCQASGQAIVLTSHSMEECEALCNRLAIMARGRLLCVGASQELKDRYGAGFNVTIKLNPTRSEEDFIEIKKKIQDSLMCELKDEHSGYLFYHITDSKTTWTKMFGIMNELKSEHRCIEDFTVSTSTLEQLFMQFAKSSAKSDTESHDEVSCVC